MGILLIFLSVCSNLSEGMIVKFQGSKNKKGGYFFNGLIALASMLFFVLTENSGFYFPKELWIYAVPSAICYCVGLVFIYLALSCGSFAISMMILSYSIVFPIVYGIVFLNESASFVTYIGFVIIGISLYLSRGDTKKENCNFSFKWLIYILISSLGNGFFAVIKRMQQLKFKEECNNEYMILTLALTTVTLFVLGIIKEKGFKEITLRGSLCALSAGLSNGITNMLTLVVNTMVAISISSPINTGMKIVLSFIISAVFLREKFLKRQFFGVALGTVALILLNI